MDVELRVGTGVNYLTAIGWLAVLPHSQKKTAEQIITLINLSLESFSSNYIMSGQTWIA